MLQSHTKMDLQIKHYISKGNAEYALLLIGKWGCGKTYYIKNLVKEIKGVKMVYYSLNGVTSVSEVLNSILLELISTETIKKGIMTGRKISGTISEIITEKSDIGKLAIKLGASAVTYLIDKYIKNFQKQGGKNLVLVLDDLERISGNIDITDLLGVIHTKFSLNGIKVIYIADNREIKDEESFEKEKEKNIRRTISFSYDKHALYKSFLEDADIFSDDFLMDLENVFNEEQENLRTIQFCLDCYKDLLDSYEKFQDENEYNSPESLFYTICQIGKFYKTGKSEKNKLEEALATYFYKSYLNNNKEPDEYETFANIYGTKLVKQSFIYDLIYDGVFSDEDMKFFLKKPKNKDDPIYTLTRVAEMETCELKENLSQVEENLKKKKYSIKQYFYFRDYFLPNVHRFTSGKDEYYYTLITASVLAEENRLELEDTFLYWLKDPSSSIKEATNSYEEKVLEAYKAFNIKKDKKELERFIENIKECSEEIFAYTIDRKNIYSLLVNTGSVEKLLSLPNKSIRYFAYYIDSVICHLDCANKYYSDQVDAIKQIISITEEITKNTDSNDILRIEALCDLEKVLRLAVEHICGVIGKIRNEKCQ